MPKSSSCSILTEPKLLYVCCHTKWHSSRAEKSRDLGSKSGLCQSNVLYMLDSRGIFFFPSKDNRHKRFEIESVIKNDSVSFWDLGD